MKTIKVKVGDKEVELQEVDFTKGNMLLFINKRALSQENCRFLGQAIEREFGVKAVIAAIEGDPNDSVKALTVVS